MAEYGGTILAVQDTTGVNYNTHVKTEGIGYISDKTLGINIHSCIAVTGDGLVLGVLDQSSYNRPESKDESASHDSKKKVSDGWKPWSGARRISPRGYK
jgi:hypothetical protein